MAGLTLEQLQKMGAKPLAQNGVGVSLDQLKNQTTEKSLYSKSAETNKPWIEAKPTDSAMVAGGKAAVNLVPSAYQLAKGFVSSAIHPVETFNSVKSIAEGTGTYLGEKINEKLGKKSNPTQEDAEKKEMAGAMGGALIDRYGSLEALQATATNDPFGLATDILSLVAGGEGMLAKAGVLNKTRTAGAISKVGGEGVNVIQDTAGIAGKAVEPITNALGGSIEKNAGKAIGTTGKMTLADTTKKLPQYVRALKNLVEEGKGTVVKDLDGVEKMFEPAKATFGETLQALKTSKDKIYNQYSEIAKTAGDAGATFTGKDFIKTANELKAMAKNATSATKGKVNSIIQDMVDNYAVVTDGKVKFNDTALSDMQKFIEDINKDVNPLSNKAGAEVSGKASQVLRDLMDSKIANSTGEGYQILRNKYRDLKSIENGLINQFKKSSRGVGSGVSDWVSGFGNLDTVVGILSGNPAQALKGVGMNWMSKVIKKMRDPETKLQKVFQQLESGKGTFQPKSKTFNAIKKIRPGMSIKDISKPILSNDELLKEAKRVLPKVSEISEKTHQIDLDSFMSVNEVIKKLEAKKEITKEEFAAAREAIALADAAGANKASKVEAAKKFYDELIKKAQKTTFFEDFSKLYPKVSKEILKKAFIKAKKMNRKGQ